MLSLFQEPAKKYYIFFIEEVLPKPDAAHIVTATQHANAAANLGYSAILVHICQGSGAWNPIDWLTPFRPRFPDRPTKLFYNLDDQLTVVPLPIPWPFGSWRGKLTNPNTLICRYYLPFHIFKHTQLFQTSNWNAIKAAIRAGIPVIYEQEHYRNIPYEPEVINNALFHLAVTLSDPVKDNMIDQGMPPGKILQLHLGYNSAFQKRHPDQANQWRRDLLKSPRKYMVVYAGALFQFKGIDLVLEVAPHLPELEFVFAGGNDEKVSYYQKFAQEKQIKNTQFLGYIPHHQLVSLLQAADILIYPHLMGEAAQRTSPLKFFEYMASGTPIVAAEIPPLQPFCSAEIAAVWFKPGDPKELIEAIHKLLKLYPRKPEGYGQTIHYAKQFSWENRIQKIVDRVQQQTGLRLTPS